MRPLALLAAATLLLSQAPAAQTPTFRAGVELVEVAVLVRDRDGRFVPDLTQADFEIIEQGAAQKVVAFDRVSMPIVRPAADVVREPSVARDVSSNERVADSRVFVLLLDALHVDARRTREVRRFARQFIERHVSATDLVTVVSPGALESATQDFTNDKVLLLAAVDSFTGTALRSATIEIEEEKRAVERGSVAIHDGKDPDDHERAGRVRSLTSVLEALAKHLDRVERRRKAVLLFSEGIGYNQFDIMGTQQRYSSDVMRAMNRAVGALMRANVALYAIDPRGLSSAEGELTETQAYGVARGHGSLGDSVEQEYALDLRLDQEELQRVKATGVRWLSRLELAPGHYQVRVAGRATRSAVTGLVTADVEVPKFKPDRPALSGVTLTSLTSVLMLTKGESRPAAALNTPPSAARTFVAGDQLTAAVDVYVPPALQELELVAQVESSDGSKNPPIKKNIGAGPTQSRTEEVAIPIDTSKLPPGGYVLRIALNLPAANADRAERDVPFEITRAEGR